METDINRKGYEDEENNEEEGEELEDYEIAPLEEEEDKPF